MKATITGTYAGFAALFELSSDSLDELLAGVLALRDHGVQPTGETRAPLRALQPGQVRALVTKIKRDGDLVRLWFRGCQYETTKLFELSDLGEVGIDYAALPDAAEVPARFFVIYALSDKKNKDGNPYRDVLWLERADGYAVRTDPLGNVIEIGGAAAPATVTAEAPEESSELDEYFPRPAAPGPAPAPARAESAAPGQAEFYNRLGELKTKRRVSFDVDKKPPVGDEIERAKKSGDWTAAIQALEAAAVG